MERRPPPAPLKAWAILSLCGTAVAEEDMMGRIVNWIIQGKKKVRRRKRRIRKGGLK
jgi:hypothetical protein